jgi:hypothetical protein
MMWKGVDWILQRVDCNCDILLSPTLHARNIVKNTSVTAQHAEIYFIYALEWNNCIISGRLLIRI